MKDGRLQEIGIALAGDLPPRLEAAFDEDGEPAAISSHARAWRDLAEELHAEVVKLRPEVDTLRKAAAYQGRLVCEFCDEEF